MAKMYIIAFVFSIVLIPACMSAPEDICPPEDLTSPCNCQKDFNSNRAIVRCEEITGNDVVVEVLNKTRDYGYEYFMIDLSSLNYIPAVAFDIKRLARIVILDSTMVSLFNEPPKTNDLQDLTLYKLKLTRAIQWDLFTGMSNLKNLTIENSPLKSIDANFVENAPKSLERISITNCSINKVQDRAFERMTNIAEITLDQGKIKEVKRSMFPSPANRFKKLSLRNNQIETIPEDLFKDMPIMQYIWLSNNLIYQVPESTYGHILLNLRTLLLDGNPIKCDCSVRWIASIKDREGSFWRNFLGNCEEPKNLHGTYLTDLRENHFQHCAN